MLQACLIMGREDKPPQATDAQAAVAGGPQVKVCDWVAADDFSEATRATKERDAGEPCASVCRRPLLRREK